MSDYYVEVFEDKAGEWRWRFKHKNGNIMADSSEGYASKSGCEDALGTVKRELPGAPVKYP